MTQNSMAAVLYVCNPDVVLREEDEDGGLLFNPDTNQVKIVNPTGLYIWKKFSSACGMTEIVQTVQQEFDDAPADEIEADVRVFIDGLLQAGFIGIVGAALE
jgi:hypothetical protein